MIGKRVGHYRILEAMGTSPMGAAFYHAEDIRSGHPVVLKIEGAGVSADTEVLQQFRRQARVLSALNHPNISSFYEVGKEGDRLFVAREWLEGQSLKDVLRGKPLPLGRVLDLGVQIADALAFAHSKKVIHSDISPSNVFVTQRGHAKVRGFEQARLIGNVAHLSPEVLSGGVADERSNVYSFGTLLYEMATGRHPFWEDVSAGSIMNVAIAILRKTPPPPRSLNPEIPLALEAVILRCLDKTIEERYQLMREVAHALTVIDQDIVDNG